MSSFDYNRLKVVGIVRPKSMTTNATIKVIGYLDTSAKFHSISPNDAKLIFSPRGEVFAHNFFGVFQQFSYACISFSVKPNENNIMTNPDSFIWDKSGEVYEYAYKITKLDDSTISFVSPSATYRNLQKIKILEKDVDGYFLSDGKLFRIKDVQNSNYILPYWDLKKNMGPEIKDCLYFNSKGDPCFVFGKLNKNSCGYLDMMPQELLASKFLREIVLPSKEDAISEEYISQYISVMHLPKEVFSQRLKRLTHILRHHEMTREQLNTLSSNPEFQECIRDSVESNIKSFIEERKKEIDETLQTYKDKRLEEITFLLSKDEEAVSILEQKRSGLEEEIRQKQSKYEDELKSIESVILERQKELAMINDSFKEIEHKKERIVDDFSVIKEVLGMSSTNIENTQHKETFYVIEQINIAENNYSSLQVFSKSLQEQLSLSYQGKAKAKDIGKLLTSYHILLLPNIEIVRSIINATGRTTFVLQHVTPQWQSFDYLWEGGLANIIEHCISSPDIMHYLILQQVNLSYLPCYLQPVINIEMGLAHFLPNNISLPNNLRILCTPTSEKGLPLASSCLKYIGCYPKSNYESDTETETPSSQGILTPKLLGNIKKSAQNSDFSSYVEDDE